MAISQVITTTNASRVEGFPAIFPANLLHNDFEMAQTNFDLQPAHVKSFLETQARSLAETLLRPPERVHYQLPDQIGLGLPSKGQPDIVEVPVEFRKHSAYNLFDRLSHTSLLCAVSQSLAELEGSPNRAVSVSAGLIRYATARTMVRTMLPSGNPVEYGTEEGEEIPTLPVTGRFYLPQWVAFDGEDHLLVNSLDEAEAYIALMRHYMETLNAAVDLAPYMVVDREYQAKRYGMLGQLVNQGRALARHCNAEMIAEIRRRECAHNLNRGFSLSLPYFDDRALSLKTHDFKVIPTGRCEFVPAFVVRAARQEEVKVIQAIDLSTSTRKHLILYFRELEKAFSQAEQ